MADDWFGYMPPPAPEPSALEKLWDMRPWKSHVGNAPGFADQLPFLSVAAGLLHPRLGGAMRDMSMARQMASAGDAPAALPPGTRSPLPMRDYGAMNASGRTVGPNGTNQPLTYEQFLAQNSMQAREAVVDDVGDRILRAAYDINRTHSQVPTRESILSKGADNINSRSSNMAPSLSVVGGTPRAAQPPASAGRPGSPMAQYEAYLNSLGPSDEAMSYWAFKSMLE